MARVRTLVVQLRERANNLHEDEKRTKRVGSPCHRTTMDNYPSTQRRNYYYRLGSSIEYPDNAGSEFEDGIGISWTGH